MSDISPGSRAIQRQLPRLRRQYVLHKIAHMSAAATTAIKAERRHEAILRDLVGQIVSGTIPAASRVPYESELAAHYAVSRTVARDAVQRLAVFGLVDVRRRSGAIVTPPERWNMLEPVVLDSAISGKPTAAFFFALFEALNERGLDDCGHRIGSDHVEQFLNHREVNMSLVVICQSLIKSILFLD